jgi:6-pyruvoyltetrahydropterin/6-carboxytetrahydropterin synthase
MNRAGYDEVTPMFTVRVEAAFSAAHFLAHYHGKCEKLHGHNYKVRVTARGPSLDGGGMLVDFGVLKKALRAVTEELDHTNLNDHPAFADGSPSAENIARFVYDRMRAGSPAAGISLVEVFETGENRATYFPDSE